MTVGRNEPSVYTSRGAGQDAPMASEPETASAPEAVPSPSSPLAHGIAAVLTIAGTFALKELVLGASDALTTAIARSTGHATFFASGLELLTFWKGLFAGVALVAVSLAFLLFDRRRRLLPWVPAAATFAVVATWRAVSLVAGAGAGFFLLALLAAPFAGAFAGLVVALHRGALSALDEGFVPGIGRPGDGPLLEWDNAQWSRVALTTAWATGIGAVVAAVVEELVGMNLALEAAVGGAIAAWIQLVRHRPAFLHPSLWIVVSIAGWVAGVASAAAVETALDRIRDFSFSGVEVLGGAILGACQWVVVRRTLERSALWIAMTTVVWSVVWVYASDLPHVLILMIRAALG